MLTGRQQRTGTARCICALLLSALVAFVAVAPVAATPTGVQCPTAVVQTITVPVSCCGKIVAYIQRAPQPGEAGFVQCRCNEKHASEVRSSSTQKLQLFMPAAPLDLDPCRRLYPELQLYPCKEWPRDQIGKTPLRPPTAA